MSSKSLDMARDLLNSWISVWKHGLFTVLCTKALLQYSQKAVQKYVKTWILKLEIATCGTKRNVIVGLALPVCVRNVRPAEERDSNWAIKSWRLNICKGKTTPGVVNPWDLTFHTYLSHVAREDHVHCLGMLRLAEAQHSTGQMLWKLHHD